LFQPAVFIRFRQGPGFGTTLIRSAFPADLHARVTHHYPPEGAVCIIEFAAAAALGACRSASTEVSPFGSRRRRG